MEKKIMQKKESENRKRKIISWVLNVLLVLLLVLGAYLLISRILGHSPSDFQLILWLFGLFGTSMLKVFSLIYNLNREMGELKTNIKNSFEKLREDIRNLSSLK